MPTRVPDIHIEVQSHGDPSGVPVIMLMGLGGQLTAWPPAFIEGLTRRGHRLITLDNRDIGRSTHLTALGTPKVWWHWLRARWHWPLKPPYTLQDMAQDTLRVMDQMGLARAHVLGISMGGMIAQRVAATAPQRVISLTSIMSTSGAPGLPGPSPKAARALMTPPRSQREDDVVAQSVRFFQAVGSPGYAQDWEAFAQQVRTSVRRDPDGRGALRQLVAILADQDRHRCLTDIACPTLVIHGDADPLVPIACGRDTAQRIPGAVFEAIPGLGHDLPDGALPLLLGPIQALWQRAEQGDANSSALV